MRLAPNPLSARKSETIGLRLTNSPLWDPSGKLRCRCLPSFAQQVNNWRGDRDHDDDGHDVLQVLSRVGNQAAQKVTEPGHANRPDHGTNHREANKARVI